MGAGNSGDHHFSWTRMKDHRYGYPNTETEEVRWISPERLLMRQRQRNAQPTESKTPFRPEKTEIVGLRNMSLRSKICRRVPIWSMQPVLDRKPAGFSHVYLSRALDNWERIILASNLDVILTKLVLLWFSHEDLSPCIFPCPEWSKICWLWCYHFSIALTEKRR